MTAVSPRERLHVLVDELPEADVPTAERVLEALRSAPAPSYSLEDAPLDDEDDSDGGLTEARAQVDRGELIPHEEAKRILGVR
jgi:hypothetical protein